MANIMIRDLEPDKALDKQALSNITGGQDGNLLYTMTGRTECVGTFLDPETNQMVQRYRCYYYRIYEVWEERDQSFCGPTCVTPC